MLAKTTYSGFAKKTFVKYSKQSKTTATQYSTLANLEEYFSRNLSQKTLQKKFVEVSHDLLKPHGFNNVNTIPFVATCRDELACSIFEVIDETWRSPNNEHGVSFSVSSLGGMILLGKTGMVSAISHAPIVDGRKRFVFYAFSHLGVNHNGELGKIKRSGMEHDSKVCGAVLSLVEEMKKGHVNLDLDPLDIEYSHLKHSMLSNIKYGVIPTASQVTHIAYETIVKDLEVLLAETASKADDTDFAVFTGIQIHKPDLQTYIWPGKCYVSVKGKRTDLNSNFM
jgi:hypothetical protein